MVKYFFGYPFQYLLIFRPHPYSVDYLHLVMDKGVGSLLVKGHLVLVSDYLGFEQDFEVPYH
jgi:hypothetical protein